MKIINNKFPIDLFLCMIWSLLLIPIILLDIEVIIRIIFGLPLILLIPGYVTVFAFFPYRKVDYDVDIIERVALSFGISLVIVALIGVALNYSQFGLGLESALFSIVLYVIIVGIIALFRWLNTSKNERFIIYFEFTKPKPKNKLDKLLTIVLAVSMILSAVVFVYAISSPRDIGQTTEFYLLGSSGNVENYPRNLNTGENASVIVGITNHEYQTINYTIEIWLVKQSIFYNETSDENETKYNNAWFMDKKSVNLPHLSHEIQDLGKPQWQYDYTFSINFPGENFKLMFLLFTTNTEEYIYETDYKDIIQEKIDSAYMDPLYLWLNVN
jgi:uncharacterized membrane protein